ncbi:MAG: quinone-dependent dihydroorotate dehydrogenase [bacterium]
MKATKLINLIYRYLAKPLFFQLNPEFTHDFICWLGELLGNCQATRRLTSYFLKYQDPALKQSILGIEFQNPVGLGAGFDKNARLTKILPEVGFGFEEVGSITGEYCPGNSKPRLWRLPKSRGLLVHYGLMNDGADAISSRLRHQKFNFPIGISIAKTNNPATVEVASGVADYVKAFQAFTDIGEYFTINISCPNAFGGEPFTTPDRLEQLLGALDQIFTNKPIFIKLPACLPLSEIDALVEVAKRHRVHGFIATNLLKNREDPSINQTEIAGLTQGAVGGKPVWEKSNQLVAHLYQTVGDKFVIIGLGGIFTAEDAYHKIKLGASLVQLVTGMIFEGPQSIGEINRGLAELLKKDGYGNIAQAVGAAHRQRA